MHGPGSSVFEMDLATVQLKDLQQPSQSSRCELHINHDGPIEGFVGYFDTSFRGSTACPASEISTLSTGPTDGTATHWGQQAFAFSPYLRAKRGDILECHLLIKRQKQNQRLLELDPSFVLYREAKGERIEVEKR